MQYIHMPVTLARVELSNGIFVACILTFPIITPSLIILLATGYGHDQDQAFENMASVLQDAINSRSGVDDERGMVVVNPFILQYFSHPRIFFN